ncbi:MAG: putative colanic acid biosynthesis glycosyl transferase [Magnetococcales bacterium]|nr:putative colanic acid biosynthesis glycosyl transferase [Magnetococcales bacterium]
MEGGLGRIIFINRYFHPDHSATSQLLSDLAFDLASHHAEVHIVTSRMRIDDPSAGLPPFEQVNGVLVHRLWTTHFGRYTMVGRLMDYLTFYFSLFIKLLFFVRKGDTVVCKTDPPLASVIALPVIRFRNARLVNWLQDLFPEVAENLGTIGLGGVMAGILRRLRNRSLTGAEINVAISEGMAQALRRQNIHPQRIRVLPNWSDSTRIFPVALEKNLLRHQLGLEKYFVVGYSGNMGRAHDFNTILEAAQKIEHHSEIVFEFVGGGVRLPWIINEVKRLGLKNVRFRSYQSRDTLAESMSVADVHLVSLMASLEGLCVPCKFYGVAAAGKPIVYVGAPEGELSGLIQKYRCGVHVNVGDAEGLANQILALRHDLEMRKKLGDNARSLLLANHDYKQAMAAWREVLGQFVNGGGPG